MEFLEKLPHLLDNKVDSWLKTSASLDASAKIYGFRVDSVYYETYKFLSGLARADNKQTELIVVEDEKSQNIIEKNLILKEKFSLKFVKKFFLNLNKLQNWDDTLEMDHKKLDLKHYDLEFDIDPLFKNMTAKFDNSGARSLLLNNLVLDSNLDLIIETKKEQNLKIIKKPEKLDIKNDLNFLINGTRN